MVSRFARRPGMLVAVLAVLCFSIDGADLPRPAPATTFRTPEGTVIDLAKYRGKVVALEFLLTTCSHCQKTSQMLQKLQNEYGSRGFQAIGVATNEMAHMLVNDFKKQFGISFPVGFSVYNDSVQWLQHPVMLTMYMPQLAFIDRKGNIRAQYGGSDKFFLDQEAGMRKEIESLLKEPPANESKTTERKSTRKSS
jgi:thiol-disulfide isomerase/thioredoxin